MKKEYMTPEAEMTKFEEIEEIMMGSFESGMDVVPMPDGWQ